MNREVLYRGRDCNGEWHQGYFTRHRNIQNKVYTAIHMYDEVDGDTYCDGLRVVDPETVGQFTGLTDKNGKKIFEGDIVDVYSYQNGETKNRIGSIGWCDGRYMIFIHNGHNEYLTQGFCNVSEVIGNIYDNPELLADKQ